MGNTTTRSVAAAAATLSHTIAFQRNAIVPGMQMLAPSRQGSVGPGSQPYGRPSLPCCRAYGTRGDAMGGKIAQPPVTLWVKRTDVAEAQYVDVDDVDLQQRVSKFKERWLELARLDMDPSLVLLHYVKGGSRMPVAAQEASAVALNDPSLNLAESGVTGTAWLLADIGGTVSELTKAIDAPPLTLPELVAFLRKFIMTYAQALPSPALSMSGTDALGKGGEFPYRIQPSTIKAIKNVFATNIENIGIPGRMEHPFGIFAGTPGSGKTRGLHELANILQTHIPSGSSLATIIFTYNNQNAFSIIDVVDLGPKTSTAMRILHAATCIPTYSFENFLKDLRARGVDSKLLRGLDLSPSDVLPIIRDRQCIPPDQPWLVILGLDDFQKPAEPFVGSSDCPSWWDPVKFIADVAQTILPLAMVNVVGNGQTAVVPFFAGTMARAVEQLPKGVVFRISGLMPLFIPLSPLTSEDCVVICSSRLELQGWWRTSVPFRRLLELVGGWPRQLESLIKLTAFECKEHHPANLPMNVWVNIESVLLKAVVVRSLPRLLQGEITVRAILGSLASVRCDDCLHVVASGQISGNMRTWGDLEEAGAVALVMNLDDSDYYNVNMPALNILAMLKASGIQSEIAEVAKLLSTFKISPSTSLSWLDFEVVLAWWEAIRLSLFVSLNACQSPQGTLQRYFGHGIIGTSASSVHVQSVFLGEVLKSSSICRQPLKAEKAFPKTMDLRDAASGKPMFWNDGTVYLNANGAPFDVFAVWQCIYNSVVDNVLIIGQCKLRSTKSALSLNDILAEYSKVKSHAEVLGFPANRWVFVLYTTDANAFNPMHLPDNMVILGGGGGLEAHLGPLLSSLLRLTARGRSVNVNLATLQELQLLEGLGTTIARAICDVRGAQGFEGWDDLVARVGPMVSNRAKAQLFKLKDKFMF